MRRLLSALAGALLFRLPFWIIASRSLPTFCNWDCGIYANISRHYTAADSAFFPLFPLLVRAVSAVLPNLSPEHSVVVTSNIFVLIAGALFLYLADGLWSAQRRYFGFLAKSWLALLLLSLFPEGHFWMRGYSEPVFFALLMAILLGLRRGDWILTGVFCGLIAVTRPQGVWVDGIVGAYLLARWLAPGGKKPSLGISVLLCGLPFLGFMAWLWAQTGNPIYFYVAQRGWGRHLDVLAGLRDQLPRWDASHFYLYLGVWAGIRFFRRPTLDWKMIGLLSLVLTELPVFFGGFFSYVRFASINPGMFLLGSELLVAAGWAAPWATLAIVIWSVIRLAVQIHLAGSGWVG